MKQREPPSDELPLIGLLHVQGECYRGVPEFILPDELPLFDEPLFDEPLPEDPPLFPIPLAPLLLELECFLCRL